MRIVRQGKCIKKDTGKEFQFIEYPKVFKIYKGSFLDGRVGKKYFKDNYEVKE